MREFEVRNGWVRIGGAITRLADATAVVLNEPTKEKPDLDITLVLYSFVNGQASTSTSSAFATKVERDTRASVLLDSIIAEAKAHAK